MPGTFFRPRWLIGLLILLSAGSLRAETPLHERVDALIAEAAEGPLSGPAEDAEFLRRIYLDLAGRIPTSDECTAFLDDASPVKRAKVIDQLLASGESARHLAARFDVMLMERRGDHEEWTRFLVDSFQANKPWDRLVREMLFPDAESESMRGAAHFITKRLEKYGQNPVDLPGLVRDVGRLFLGIDVQCAQCHDHLFIDDYKQVDYQGLQAYLGHTFIRSDTDFPAVGENLVKEPVEFTSVFESESMKTGPRLPGGREIEIPELSEEDAYLVPPDRKARTPGVPRFRPLEILSRELPRGDNRLFVRNIANRVWWLMMGRGLVHPLDLHHSGNPPSHPEVLDLLADELVAHDFDLRWLIGELALSQAYQRSSLLPESWADDAKEPPRDRYQVALEKPLTAEQMLAAVMVATGAHRSATGDVDENRQAAKDGAAKDGAAGNDEQVAKAQARRKELLEQFRAALAPPPREPETEIRPTVKAALFLSNDDLIQSWLQPRDELLLARLERLDDPKQLADQLYLSILSRRPDSEEIEEVRRYLEQQPNRSVALNHLAWALLASTEFCVNH